MYESDPLYLRISTMLVGLCDKVEESASRAEQQRAASRRLDELESRLADERHLHAMLSARLQEVERRGGEVGRVCAQLEAGLSITDSDRTRLDTAKEMYQIAKELTGIRWDFTAPPTVAKGYVKNEARKLLEPFELCAGVAGAAGGEALWARVAGGGARSGGSTDNENYDPHL